MRSFTLLLLFLVSCSALAQQKKDTTELYYYGARWYGTDPCKNCPFEDKKKVASVNPYQKYIDDKNLWEWRTIDLGVGEPQKVYDLKPQYKDTLKLKDGSIMEVPFWIKKNSTKKPKTTR